MLFYKVAKLKSEILYGFILTMFIETSESAQIDKSNFFLIKDEKEFGASNPYLKELLRYKPTPVFRNLAEELKYQFKHPESEGQSSLLRHQIDKMKEKIIKENKKIPKRDILTSNEAKVLLDTPNEDGDHQDSSFISEETKVTYVTKRLRINGVYYRNKM